MPGTSRCGKHMEVSLPEDAWKYRRIRLADHKKIKVYYRGDKGYPSVYNHMFGAFAIAYLMDLGNLFESCPE